VAKERSKPAPRPKRTHVSASVKLDVATHAKVSAAAALVGVSKSTWMERAIVDALQGIVVFDRKAEKAKIAEHVDLSGDSESADAA
jgi:hypothetical protein